MNSGRRTAPNYKHSIESSLSHFTLWNSGRLQCCSLSAWRIPLKAFQRQLARISAAVKKDGAYAESKFQFSCGTSTNILTTIWTNQKARLINVTITTSCATRDYSLQSELHAWNFLFKNAFSRKYLFRFENDLAWFTGIKITGSASEVTL